MRLWSFATFAVLATLTVGLSLPKQDLNARSDSVDTHLSKRTDAYPYTNDQAVNIGVGRLWFYGVTAQQVTDNLNLYKARITQIRVDNPNIPTFTVTMVVNSGSYGSSWWWYFGQDANQLGTLLDGKRLISLDPYYTSAGLRFAAVMVPNTGVQGRAWWWYFGLDVAGVSQNINANNARLVSARPYRSGGSGSVVYAVIMVSNTGVDFKGWQWLPSRTISTIAAEVNSKQQRVVAFSPNPAGDFDAILINSEGEHWWWWYGLDATAVGNNIVNHNTRLIDISPYFDNGVRKFTIVELDDSNPEQAPINAESTRVRNNAEANGWKGGFHGTYAIQSGSANPVVAYNSRFRFEPASAMKALYLLYTLKQGISLTTPITYYWTDGTVPPPGSICPLDVPEIPANAHTVTIGDALTGMIKSSNNIYTRAFAKYWGTGPVQAMATSLGMSGTFLNQAYIGCGFRGAVRNEVSLADFATLYHAVDSGSALSGTQRQIFLDTLVGGPGAGGNVFSAVINRYAPSLSIASEFLSALDIRWKAGSYGFGLAPAGTSKIDYSFAGLARVPFKNATGQIVQETFFIGDFINDLVIHCPSTPPCPESDSAGALLFGSVAEALSGPISDALKTWSTPFSPENTEYVDVNTEAGINDNFIGWMDSVPGGELIRWVNSAFAN